MIPSDFSVERPLVKPPLPELLRCRVTLKLRKTTAALRALPDFVIAGAQKCGTSIFRSTPAFWRDRSRNGYNELQAR